MEGPTVLITGQQLQPFVGKKIKSVSGNTAIDHALFLHKHVRDIFTWGKHLDFQFDDFALRVHFMILGTYEGVVDGLEIKGDYPKTRDMKLRFEFENGYFAMYSCNLKIEQTADLKSTYDYTTDVMSKKWDGDAAYEKLMKKGKAEISDALLDQNIFTGVGNKIRNEILFEEHILPTRLVSSIDPFELKELVEATHALSWQFMKWREKDELNSGQHWKIYKKKICTVCGGPVTHAYTGKLQRSSYFCQTCQK
jgi:endonuclease-8